MSATSQIALPEALLQEAASQASHLGISTERWIEIALAERIRLENDPLSPAFRRHTPSFGSFDEVSNFFRKGDCGFSCSLRGELEGLQLKTLKWEMTPLEIESQHSAFYSDSQRFPAGSLEFDCGLLMRGIQHEWHELTEIPELAVHAR